MTRGFSLPIRSRRANESTTRQRRRARGNERQQNPQHTLQQTTRQARQQISRHIAHQADTRSSTQNKATSGNNQASQNLQQSVTALVRGWKAHFDPDDPMDQASVGALVEYVGRINGSANQAGQPNFLPGLVNELELDSILQIVENNYSEHILASVKPVEQRPSDIEAWARFEAAATAAGHMPPKKTEAEKVELAQKRERMAKEAFEKAVRRDLALTAARFGRMEIM